MGMTSFKGAKAPSHAAPASSAKVPVAPRALVAAVARPVKPPMVARPTCTPAARG